MRRGASRREPETARRLRLPGPRRVALGAGAFALFSAAGIVVLIQLTGEPERIEALTRIAKGSLLLVILLTALDYLLAGFRFRLFLDGRVLPFVSLWNCMRSNWANMFLGAVTPFWTGGGPAQLYVLWRCGVKVSQGTLVSLINLVATFVVFLLAATMALAVLPGRVLGHVSPRVVQGGFVALGILGLAVILSLALPHKGVTVVRAVVRRIPERHGRARRLARRFAAAIVRELKYFRAGMRRILLRRRITLVATFATTLALYLNKYMIGYVLARALAGWVPFDTVMGLQAVQYLLIYFAPTPGASGIAELSSAWLMSFVLTPELLVFYVALWRFFSTVLGAIIGAAVLFGDFYALHHRRKRKRHEILSTAD